MNRRTYLRIGAGIGLSTLAGCQSGGIFAGMDGGTPTAARVTTPDLTTRNASPPDATTTFSIRWRAIAASEFDRDSNDGKVTAAPDGEKFVILGYAVENVGDTTHEFTADQFNLRTDDVNYQPKVIVHLTPHVQRPIKPGDRLVGWVPFSVPSDLSAAELVVDQWNYDEPVAVEFERDDSVSLPF